MGVIGAGLGLFALGGWYWLGWWFLNASLYQGVEDKDRPAQVRNDAPAGMPFRAFHAPLL
jgi:hypothetical protein